MSELTTIGTLEVTLSDGVKITIDTSRYNSQRRATYTPIDWKTARDEGNVGRAILKAMGGFSEADPFFVGDLEETEYLGIEQEAYLIFYPNQDPFLQAATQWHFLRSVGFADNGVRGISCDFERWAAEAEDVYAYLMELGDRAGRAPDIYTSPGYWNAYIGYQEWARNFELWVAFWNLQALSPMLPKGFKTWKRWQYRQDGQVPGIVGRVDLSRENTNPGPNEFMPIYHGVVRAYHLNVRSGAGTQNQILETIDGGDLVEVYDELGSWLMISLPLETPQRWVHSYWIRRI